MSTDRTTPAPGDDLGLQLARENIAAGLADINDSCLLLARYDALRADIAAVEAERDALATAQAAHARTLHDICATLRTAIERHILGYAERAKQHSVTLPFQDVLEMHEELHAAATALAERRRGAAGLGEKE